MLNDVTKLVLIAIVALVAYNVVNNNNLIKNSGSLQVGDYTQGMQLPEPAVNTQLPQQKQSRQKVEHSQIDDIYENNPNVLPHPQMSNNFSSQGNWDPSTQHNMAQLNCLPKDQLIPEELLPREGGFADSNPAPQGHLSQRNFFESGHHPGLNTQSSTLKNPNLQLRSDPLIPRRDVGPWNQSTFEPDTNRRQFDIGGI